jgi:hypothetical protein
MPLSLSPMRLYLWYTTNAEHTYTHTHIYTHTYIHPYTYIHISHLWGCICGIPQMQKTTKGVRDSRHTATATLPIYIYTYINKRQ